MIVGCYSLHLYCVNYPEPYQDDGVHEYDEFPHEITDEYGSKCRSAARRAGWKLNLREGTAICPKCTALHPEQEKEK